MEPANLNSAPREGDDGGGESDARLAALLRDRSTALADEGFSARVLAALPPPRRTPTPALGRRLAVGWAGAVAGIAFALWRGTSPTDLQTAFDQTGVALLKATAVLADPVFVIAFVATGLSLLFAFKSELRTRLFS